jgi:hypothetical protein
LHHEVTFNPTRQADLFWPHYRSWGGVRPSDWTVSCGDFDSLPGVVILELCRA